MIRNTITALVLVFFAGLVIANAPDVYVAGDFLMTIIDDADNNLHHISGIATYNPNANVFEDSFGGVYESQGAKLTEIQYTSLGMYVIGNFRFFGDGFSYSNTVLRYDDDDGNDLGRYLDMGNGIWTNIGESVQYCVGTQTDVIFAGFFTRVEDITYQNYLNDEADVVVPNIVRYDPDSKEWNLLDDPDAVFPYPNAIDGLASKPKGDSKHVYIHIGSPSLTLYSWSEDDYYTNVAPLNIMAGSLVVDSNGNPAGINMNMLSPSGNSARNYSLVYLDSDNDFAQTSYDFLDIPENFQIPTDPKVIAYLDGLLVVTLGGVNFTSSDFLIFDPATGMFDGTSIPRLDFYVSFVVEGDNGDVWVAPTSATRELYYYTVDQGIWIALSLESIDNSDFSIISMTYNFDKDILYVYALDTLSRDYLWFVFDTSVSYPPTPSLKNPGVLALDGTVNALVVIKDQNDEDFGLWAGGVFSAVGNGVLSDNLACFKSGYWRSYSKPPIVSMTAKNQTLIIAYDDCASNGELLPIGTFNTDDSDDVVVFESLPVVIGGAGCVFALFADENYLFVGGNFSVSIPGSSATAHAVVGYNWKSATWFGIGLTSGISSSGDGYQILSLTVTALTDSTGTTNNYLGIGGHFDVTISQGSTNNVYHSYALYNLDTGDWAPTPPLDTDSIIYEAIPYMDNEIYLGGRMYSPSAPAATEGVVVLNFTTNSFVEVGALQDTAQAILLLTMNTEDDDDSNDYTVVYGGGDFEDVDDYQYGLAAYNFDAYLTGESTNTTWGWAGGNVFSHYYNGNTFELVYETGGAGQNGTNGYYPVSSGGGNNGWWIALLCVLFVLVFVGAIGAGVAGFVYYKKRTTYQEIN